MEEGLYPLGTAVKTRFSEMPLLVAGYYPIDTKNKRVAKYIAVDCALGFGNGGAGILLEDSDITEVVSEGFTNERGDEYRRNIFLMYEKAGLKELVKQNLEKSEVNDSSAN